MTQSGRLCAVSDGRLAAWPAGADLQLERPRGRPPSGHRLNVDGDDQADPVGRGGEHRAVFVCQREPSAGERP